MCITMGASLKLNEEMEWQSHASATWAVAPPLVSMCITVGFVVAPMASCDPHSMVKVRQPGIHLYLGEPRDAVWASLARPGQFCPSLPAPEYATLAPRCTVRVIFGRDLGFPDYITMVVFPVQTERYASRLSPKTRMALVRPPVNADATVARIITRRIGTGKGDCTRCGPPRSAFYNTSLATLLPSCALLCDYVEGLLESPCAVKGL